MFHVSEARLKPGDVIQPLFGRYLSASSVTSRLRVREVAFEEVRQAEFPHLPSKLTSVFLFGSLADAVPYSELPSSTPAEMWRAKAIYRVEIPADAVTFRADMMWAIRGHEGRMPLDVAARGYWSGQALDNLPWFEVLCSPPVSVVRMVPEEEMAPHRGKLVADPLGSPSDDTSAANGQDGA